MLKIRIIPTLLWKNFGLVKGVGFNSWRRVGALLPSVKVYNTRDVDELIFMDIAASDEGGCVDQETVSDFSAECFVPLTVGGGITKIDEILAVLHAGADKVLINSAAYSHPELIKSAACRFGTQCIVAGIDVKLIGDSGYVCCSHAGKVITNKNPVEWAKELVSLGAGEIMITSIDRDGTMSGYDLSLIESITKIVDVPVIASGGAGNYEHFCDAVLKAGASAVAASSMFHFTEQTPREAKRYLASKGIPVRKSFCSVAESQVC